MFAQGPSFPSSIGIIGGVSTGNNLTGTVGIDLRSPSLGRIAPTFGIERWYRQVGCDNIIGAPCDGGAWNIEAGLIAYFAQHSGTTVPYSSVKIGRIFPDLPSEKATWHPSVAVGVIFLAQRSLGFLGELKYSALTAGTPPQPEFVDRADRLALRGGLRIAF